MEPVAIIKALFWLIVVVPMIAAVLAFAAEATMRRIAQAILAFAWLASAVAVIVCLWLAFGRPPSSGIGNGVFVFVALAPAIPGFIWWTVWRIARRREYLQSLPPDLRRSEELADIESGIEQMRKDLAGKKRRADSWLINGEERARLRFEISLLETSLARLEEEAARRRSTPASFAG